MAAIKYPLVLVAALAVGLSVASDQELLDQPLDQHVGVEDRDDTVTTWLPRELEPLHYRVRIQPQFLDSNFTSPADLEFTFRARAPTSRVVVNARNLTIDEGSVVVEQEGPPGRWTPLPLLGHVHDATLETYAAELQAPLRPSRQENRRAIRYRLKMNYTALVGENLKGLYRTSYLDDNNNKRWIALTQLHPTNARAMFPCLDEPQYKARFTLSVARHKDHTSVANMPVRTTEPMAGSSDWMWDHFETSVPMSSYLIALAVFDFGKLESTADFSAPPPPPAAAPTTAGLASSRNATRAAVRDVSFRVWARQADLARGAYAAHVGPPVLKYFSRIFNISFPLVKLDMIAAPKLFYNAMENWGIITFREGALLVDEADMGSRHYVATIVAHELAHQWFGNLVTMRWWNDVWLNEGFATYMSQLGVSHVEPQWRSEGIFVLENMQGVMQLDALPSSHPVSRQVHQVADIGSIFDAISYKKGSSLVRMMSEFLGPRVFQHGLNTYLRKHAYANAAQDDLWAALTDAARGAHALPRGQSVKSIMDSWTLRTGFPVLTVTRDYGAGTAKVAQERFLVATNANESTAPVAQGEAACCWGVPLWVKTVPLCSNRTTSGCNSSSTEELLWLLRAEVTLAGLPPGPGGLLLNGARAGYYRTNYDATNWAMLTESLDSLTDLERAGLVDDALALAGAGRLGYDVPLALLQRLPRDAPSLAWVAALPWLAKLTHLLHGVPAGGAAGSGGDNAFTRWARALAGDLLRVSEGLRLSTDPVDHAFVSRVQLWACGLGVPGCLGTTGPSREARQGFDASVLCKAQKTEKEWGDVLSKYLSENPAFIPKLAECIQSQEAAKGMLELAALETNHEQLTEDLLEKLTANPYSYNAVVDFLKDNWMQLQAKFGTIDDEIAKSILPYVKNENQIIQLEKMISSKKNGHLMNEGKHNVWWLQYQAEKLLEMVNKLKL
ncbi:hypothetical protein FOCC_FOCC013119 [Frankliniella occidentalis]|uniref:Aminopeptidase n=1 Tax=Frankliniella occidentalis TaxID=133901 RepID=A0A6J1TLP0_FRAOC|nr:thyrotropin-releasing hormone-degrading ectoenzyme-like [Frankliniella occidentalis]KAE8741352.1 hypothetical protein FOCC_FOCC013119 [Frankliniella occidentalis]